MNTSTRYNKSTPTFYTPRSVRRRYVHKKVLNNLTKRIEQLKNENTELRISSVYAESQFLSLQKEVKNMKDQSEYMRGVILKRFVPDEELLRNPSEVDNYTMRKYVYDQQLPSMIRMTPQYFYNNSTTVLTVVYNRPLRNIVLDNENIVIGQEDTEIVVFSQNKDCPIPEILETRIFSSMFSEHGELSGFQIRINVSLGNTQTGFYDIYLKSKSRNQHITIPIPMICIRQANTIG
jgi:hypothetical protein